MKNNRKRGITLVIGFICENISFDLEINVLTLKCMAKITWMTSKFQNTTKNDISALKLAENEVLHDLFC